jgi:hypothetical protein
MEDKIIETYKTMLISGEEAINSFTLSNKLGISEKEFFQHFSSTEDVGRRIWAKLGDEVIESLNNSEEVAEYSSLNKILAYYFTFFEIALGYRSFIERTIDKPELLRSYKDKFKEYVSDIIQEGIAMEEIVERLSLSSYYPDMLWQLHLRLVNFWLQDTSEHFVETEKAIEVYSKLPLEFMQHNLMDSVYETVKFSFEQLKPERLSLESFNIFKR